MGVVFETFANAVLELVSILGLFGLVGCVFYTVWSLLRRGKEKKTDIY